MTLYLLMNLDFAGGTASDAPAVDKALIYYHLNHWSRRAVWIISSTYQLWRLT